MIGEKRLSEIISEGVGLRPVEPHVYSVFPRDEEASLYDRWFGGVYETVACNRLYNRVVWGYDVSEYGSFCLDALKSSSEGWVLDAGCGSLAFTAKTYLDYFGSYPGRPIVFLDRSLRMLMSAKSKIVKLNGDIPSNMVFLHADVLGLPFKPESFGAIVSLNVLHALEDIRAMLRGLKGVLRDGGSMHFTTLVENNRLADKYLHKLGRGGYLTPRSREDLLSAFAELGMPAECRIGGNLAFIKCR